MRAGAGLAVLLAGWLAPAGEVAGRRSGGRPVGRGSPARCRGGGRGHGRLAGAATRARSRADPAARGGARAATDATAGSRLKLPAGTHNVAIVLKGSGQKIERDVPIRPGKTIALQLEDTE